MHPATGIAIDAAAGMLAVVTGWRLRTVLPPLAIDALMAVAGAGLGAGGLLMLDDVGIASWVAAPAVLALVGVLHQRALFARGGPLRT